MTHSRQNRPDRYGGRMGGGDTLCAHPDCAELGEFRAPAFNGRLSGADGPGDYQLLCLDHVREFNAGYDWFEGMTAQEIAAAQSPTYVWPNETRAFSAAASVDSPPKWQDFHDPLDAIGARFRRQRDERSAEMNAAPLSSAEHNALKLLGLTSAADKKAIRKAYSEKLRTYHPDRNGGDRSHERELQATLEAWAILRESKAFD
ncbi:J domain-containing protein [Sphingorhabdus arenilitoris]|uniref:J domain-containing protein n=1 Tax=Sphingorhabdus arenilitoris TaxID=1490041 RepID=A0ABV8RIW8_9SPHN